jgi:hypothetical protein
MPQLLHRNVEVSFVPAAGGTSVLIKDLQVEFTVDRTLEKEPSLSDIRIYNLKDETAALIRDQENVVATLRVGYGTSDLQTIFTGDVNKVTQRIEGPDRVLEVEAGDGKWSSRQWARKRFKPDAKLEDVIMYLADVAGLKANRSDISQTLDDAEAQNQRRGFYAIPRGIKNGYHVRGYAVDELHELCLSRQMEFSIQNNELRITIDDGSIGETVLLTPSSGLVGSPVVDQKGKLSAECLLVPNLYPGSLVSVDSRYVTGDYRVLRATYTGSLFGSDPMTISFEGKRV